MITMAEAIGTENDDRRHAVCLISYVVLAQLASQGTLWIQIESMRLFGFGVLYFVFLIRPNPCGIPYLFMIPAAIASSILIQRLDLSFEASLFLSLLGLIVFAILFRNNYLGISRCTGYQKFSRPAGEKRRSILRTVVQIVLGFRDALTLWLTYGRYGTLMPGHYRSPAGSYHFRLALTAAVMVLVACPFYAYAGQFDPATQEISILASGAIAVASYVLAFILPLPVMLLVAFVFTLTILSVCYTARKDRRALPDSFYEMIEAALCSNDEDERESVPIGQVVHDNSPVLLPYEPGSHLMLSGSTGAGKTAMTMRLLESYFLRENVSILAVDIKAFTHELYHTLVSVVQRVEKRTGRRAPIWRFTNRSGDSSHLFSLFHHSFWPTLPPEQQADILLRALSIPAERIFGESWFGDACYHILVTVFTKYRDITSFRELVARVDYELKNPNQNAIPKAVLQDGVHVYLILNRLALLEQLNDCGQHGTEVTDNAIDLSRLYKEPCVVYASLAALHGQIAVAELGTILIEATLQAGLHLNPQERQMNVVILAEDSATLLSTNMNLCLQQARATNTSIWISVQAVSDLEKGSRDLVSTTESNVAAQLWFKSIDRKGIQQIEELSGVTTEPAINNSVTLTPDGVIFSKGYSEQVVPRLRSNDILRAASQQHHYIARIASNSRYAHFNCLPFVATTGGFHIPEGEYHRRKNAPWPPKTPDTITVGLPADDNSAAVAPSSDAPSGPIVDIGTIGQNSLRQRRRTSQ